MGCCCSRGNAEVTVGEHSPLPRDTVPYKGAGVQCSFLDMSVLGIVPGNTFMARYLRTDFAPHYAAFTEPLMAGFRPVLLKRVPGVQHKHHVQHGMERRYDMAFQAVFVRPGTGPHSAVGSAKVVHTAVEFIEDVAPSGVEGVAVTREVANMAEFDAQVEENGRSGYQLVSFEPSAYSKKNTHAKETVLQMDLVFFKAFEPTSSSFIYHSIVVPVSYRSNRQLPASRRRLYEVVTDVSSIVSQTMQQGWKIVDTNYLSSHLQGQFAPRDETLTFNTMWIFEKPEAAANDLRPRWECSIIKYRHIVKLACNGTKTITTWNPLVEEMSGQGWELACILDTAEAIPAGCAGVNQLLLLVFQRPLFV